MKTAKLEDLLYWEDKLYKVVGIGTGKTLTLDPLGNNGFCPHCKKGIKSQVNIIEACPNFQNGAKPIETIEP